MKKKLTDEKIYFFVLKVFNTAKKFLKKIKKKKKMTDEKIFFLF